MIFSKEKGRLKMCLSMIWGFTNDLKTVVLSGKKDVVNELEKSAEHLEKAIKLFDEATRKSFGADAKK